MKLVKKVVKSARRIQMRRKASAARGNIAHTFAAFFDALPSTAPDTAGAEAFAKVFPALSDQLAPIQVIVDDARNRKRAGRADAVLPAGGLSDLSDLMAGNGPYALYIGTVQPLTLWQAAKSHLARCNAVQATLPGLQTGAKTSDAIAVTEELMAQGFEPILRSATGGGEPFQVILLRRAQIGEHAEALANLIETACAGASKPGANLNADIPVLIPCFNNQTYCCTMVSQLRARGFENVTLVDNASTSAEMHAFLDEIEDVVTVDRLQENLGPKHSIFANGRWEALPRHFCVTDPDIVFNPFLPEDFIAQLIDQTERLDTGKAGFALDISHRQFFSDTVVHLLYQEWKIWEWEERFWTDPVGHTRSNDTVFRADIDTTFGVYDKDRWSRDDFCTGVRVGGRFTAAHVPWHAQSDVPEEERAAYKSESAFSYYKM